MDEWLDKQGLYRKNTALDGTCLFRAVAEQLFSNHAPNGHILLREQCVDFLKKNRLIFESKVLSGPYDDYLDNLSDSKQWAGQLELEALSLIYKVDFLVFKSVDLAPVPATENNFGRKIMLCFTPDNYYDAVYPKSYIENAGFCQSIVYGILYRGVFKLDDLEYAVEKMLHDKSARAQREKYLNSQSQSRDDNSYDFYLEDSEGPINMKELLDMGAILFPYKVAKALDPDIYRNIDFDNWVDTLRVPRKNSFWFGNGGPLRVGVKCLLKLDDKIYNAHVQEMNPDYGPVLVFVEELGEKLTVPFESLDPLPRTSLKPEWTFSHKHQIINKLNANKLLGNETKEEPSKSKARNKNRRIKEVKYPGSERRRDNDILDRQSSNDHVNDVHSTMNGKVSSSVSSASSVTSSNIHSKNYNHSFNQSNNSNNPHVLNHCKTGYNGMNSSSSSGGSYNSNSHHHNNGNNNNGYSGGNSNGSTYCHNTSNSSNVVVIAEPDSTTPNHPVNVSPTTPRPIPHYTSTLSPSPTAWAPTPPRYPQPHVVKTINMMVNKSVKIDCSDLPLSDLETVRFFFNLGLDYFRMGCLVLQPGSPPSPVDEVSSTRQISEVNGRVNVKTAEEVVSKSKVYKNQKPPRFMKLENVEYKNVPEMPRSASVEEAHPPEMVPEHIPVAVQYAPQYTVQYPVPYRYPVTMPESIPMESAPIAYPEPATHYVEPYTVPYTVYPHPQYFYPN